jgi:hypothetical protein
VEDLLASQDAASGAIKQQFGKGNESGRCSPCAPQSNAAYGEKTSGSLLQPCMIYAACDTLPVLSGSGEGPIMHDGTEPLSDALYTLSFAVTGLREAFGATGVQRYAVSTEPSSPHYVPFIGQFSREGPIAPRKYTSPAT